LVGSFDIPQTFFFMRRRIAERVDTKPEARWRGIYWDDGTGECERVMAYSGRDHTLARLDLLTHR
jgi:hypothetical protein